MELLPQFNQSNHNYRKTLRISKRQVAAITYHSKFNYPLTRQDLHRWIVGPDFPTPKYQKLVSVRDGYYFVNGEDSVNARLQKQKHSLKKLAIAKKAAKILEKVPTVKFVGITGSLAMFSANHDADIDLMVITSPQSLWITRLLVLPLMKLSGFDLRKPKDKKEKDKLCFNLWMDELALKWEEKNEFIAHEIAQIIPLISKDKTYEKFLYANKWVSRFWPKAVEISKVKNYKDKNNWWLILPNLCAFVCQYVYMYKKITNEVVSLTRAQFHPKKI